MATKAEQARPQAARVLVVDDEPGVVEVVRRILEGAGWLVTCAEDGATAEAAVAADGDAFAAVLLDLSLPDTSGANVLATIRTRCPDLPVMLSSGLPETYVRDQHGELPYASFVAKPFRPAELIGALESVLASARPTPQATQATQATPRARSPLPRTDISALPGDAVGC